jgi:hypothetical protein
MKGVIRKEKHRQKNIPPFDRGKAGRISQNTAPQTPRPPRFPLRLLPYISRPAFALTPLRHKTQTRSTRKDSLLGRVGRIELDPTEVRPDPPLRHRKETNALWGNGAGVGACQARAHRQVLHALCGEARGRRGRATWDGRHRGAFSGGGGGGGAAARAAGGREGDVAGRGVLRTGVRAAGVVEVWEPEFSGEISFAPLQPPCVLLSGDHGASDAPYSFMILRRIVSCSCLSFCRYGLLGMHGDHTQFCGKLPVTRLFSQAYTREIIGLLKKSVSISGV